MLPDYDLDLYASQEERPKTRTQINCVIANGFLYRQ